jgi:two-component system chemotaxis response regulator CheB
MVRVLVVDDSALVREILNRGLSADPDIEVVGTASDPYRARDLIISLRPDVLTLDVEMPRMDGLEFLRKLMPQYPIPVVMVSSLTASGSRITLECLTSGAIDFVMKPASDLTSGLGEMMEELREKVKMAATVDVSHWLKARKEENGGSKEKLHNLTRTTDKVLAIGASTGGTEAIRQIISVLPAHTPGTVIVQHMPAGFTRMYAERLNTLSEMEVKEAQSGDRVMTGRVLIAPGNFHMQLIRSGGTYQVICRDGSRICGHRPSVDVLFRSVAKYAGQNAIGVMLTGMGYDGADAMVKMRQSGARTVAQDEATSIVFGMPKEAYARGGAEFLSPLNQIPIVINDFLAGMN